MDKQEQNLQKNRQRQAERERKRALRAYVSIFAQLPIPLRAQIPGRGGTINTAQCA